jgi:Flp pilus assembly protein TadB
MADHKGRWHSFKFELGLPSALKSTCRFTKGGRWYEICLENISDEIRHVLDREFKNPDQLAATKSGLGLGFRV